MDFISGLMVATIFGLVLAAIYAIAASGLVLTYTTSGVFNFAHGAQIMFGAFVYWQLADLGVPPFISLLLTTFVGGPAMGYIVYLLIGRGLRDTAIVAKIVATVALMIGLISIAQIVWPQENRRSIPLSFSDSGNVIGKFLHDNVVDDPTLLNFTDHQVITVLAALGVAGFLRFIFKSTRLGVQMRAAVDDPDLLRLNAMSPEKISASSWMIGSAMAFLAGALFVPSGVVGTGLAHIALALLVIDAFAAALFGRLKSLPLTFLGAAVLGLGSTYLGRLDSNTDSIIILIRNLLPSLALFAVLLLLPADAPRAQAKRTRERFDVPTVKQALIWSGALLTVLLLMLPLLGPVGEGLLFSGLAVAIIALSLTLLTGYAGEVNLVPFAFAAVGAVVAYHLSKTTPLPFLSGSTGEGLDVSFGWWVLPVAAAVTALVGALVAWPAARLRGIYLALATLAFGGIVAGALLTRTTPYKIRDIQIFPAPMDNGLLSMPAIPLIATNTINRPAAVMFAGASFCALAVIVVAIRNSSLGRRMIALRDSPAAAATLGQNSVVLKIGAFAISAAIAGFGGVLYAVSKTTVGTDTFEILLGLMVVVATVVAGIGYVSGALVGGLVAGAGIGAFTAELSKLGGTSDGGPFEMLGLLIPVGLGAVGVLIARSPTGLLHPLFEGYKETWAKARNMTLGVGVTIFVLYLLALLGVISVFLFMMVSISVIVLGPTVIKRNMPKTFGLPIEPNLELVGITEPYSHAMLNYVERKLGIPVTADNTVTSRTKGELR